MANPFKIPQQPAGIPTGAAEELPAPPPGVGIRQSKDTGQPLATPSEETLEGRSHGHSPRIPWPTAGGPDDVRRPMKLK